MMALIVHWGGCTWPQGCTCVENHGRYPKLQDREKTLEPEELVEYWNDYAAKMGRSDTWAVVEGQVVKINWGKKED